MARTHIDQRARARRAWPRLVDVSRRRGRITYGALAAALGLHHRAASWFLGEIQRYCRSRGSCRRFKRSRSIVARNCRGPATSPRRDLEPPISAPSIGCTSSGGRSGRRSDRLWRRRGAGPRVDGPSGSDRYPRRSPLAAASRICADRVGPTVYGGSASPKPGARMIASTAPNPCRGSATVK